MRLLRQKVPRWRGTFRAVNRADHLLLYAGPATHFGSTIWHSHRRNDFPHVHIEPGSGHKHVHEQPGEHPGLHHHRHVDSSNDHSIAHDHRHHSHEDHHDQGHWHFVVAGDLLGVSYQLLVLAVAEVLITTCDVIPLTMGFLTGYSARGPPHFDLLQ